MILDESSVERLDPMLPPPEEARRVDNALVFTASRDIALAAGEAFFAGQDATSNTLHAVAQYVAEYADAGASLMPLFPERAEYTWKAAGLEVAVAKPKHGAAALGGTQHLRVAHPSHVALLERRLKEDPEVRRVYRPPVQYPLGFTAVSTAADGIKNKKEPQWALDRCRFPDVWDDLEKGVAPGAIALIDQGINYQHAEVNGRVTTPFLATSPAIPSRSIHASAVVGVLTSDRHDGSGISGCCSARVELYNAWSKTAFESGAFYEALHAVAHSGASVLNLSMGSTLNDPVVKERIAECIANKVIVVAAMGNDGADGSPSMYPAAFDDVIAVGATNEGDARATWSSEGPHIFISAPGNNILTLFGPNRLRDRAGTSFAAPMVSAAVWLIRRARPCWGLQEVKEVLKAAAVPSATARFEEVGHGRLDMVNVRDEIKKRPCSHAEHILF